MGIKLELVAEAIEQQNTEAAGASLTDMLAGIDNIDVAPFAANAPEIHLQVHSPDAFEDVLRAFDASGNVRVTGEHAASLHKFRIQDILDTATAKMVFEGLNDEEAA